MSNEIEIQKKKLIFRSLHRGTKEMDTLLGKFAVSEVPEMKIDDLNAYEAFMEEEDPDLYHWITMQKPTPDEKQSSMLSRLMAFHGFVA